MSEKEKLLVSLLLSFGVQNHCSLLHPATRATFTSFSIGHSHYFFKKTRWLRYLFSFLFQYICFKQKSFTDSCQLQLRRVLHLAKR